MSLVKRLWLAVIAITFIAGLLSIGIHVRSAQSYLENELKIKNMDTANSLAISVSQSAKDRVTAELLVSSQFDLGHYRWIEFYGVDGKLMTRKAQEKSQKSSVPTWFMRLVPVEPAPGSATIQAGWIQLGTVKLQSDPSFAYDSIWSASVTLSFWFGVGGGVMLLLGTLFIRSIIRPLNSVVDQAEALSERRFIEIPPPKPLEFRRIVESMNRLTRKIKNLLDNESARLEKLKTGFEIDKLTGFKVREVHLRQVQSTLEREDTQMEGLMLLLHINNLVELNREIGRTQSDQLVKNLAQTLTTSLTSCPDALLGRLNGPDFNILVPGINDPMSLLEALKTQYQEIEGLKLLRLSFAFATYNESSRLGELLSTCDKNLTVLNAQSIFMPLAQSIDAQRPASQWKQILDAALRGKEFLLGSFAVRGVGGALLHTEAPARIRSSIAKEMLVAGSFLPWARSLGLGGQIDLAILSQAMAFIQNQPEGICVNFGFESVCDERIVNGVIALLRTSKLHTKHLYLDVPEDIVFEHFEEFSRFCEHIVPLGCHVGVEHLDKHIGRLGKLSGLGLSYIKVNHSLVRGIMQDTSTQTLLQGLCNIGHTMGMDMIAEGVAEAGDIDLLYTLGFDGLTGSAIQ